MPAHSNDYNVVLEVEPDEGDLEFQGFATTNNQSSGGYGRSADPGATGRMNTSQSFFGNSSTAAAEANGGHQASQGQYALWHVEYYAQFFNVDTPQVLDRMWQSIVPTKNFLDTIAPNPDMYGPFWIPTTVIFVMFVTSSLAQSVVAYLHGAERVYDFTTLSFAVFTVYPYWLLASVGVWATTKYFGCQPSLLEILGIYGYSFTIWIPIAVACVVPHDLVRWILTLVAFASSAFFICRNIFNIISRSNATVHRALILVVLLAHAAIALVFKIRFFSYSVKAPMEPSP
ncbi:hypothetical protein H4R34_003505 [Dimargaris verticillata]|uniref:Protein YIP n=1 Tax=Dimargaris verticillata TaxID=2761393 RepID=A0A9W8B235_9FUNG|nr:hypothetical protein H4R34_003505 [Dimargaris verticillata]